ncbi:MAG: hypothetical protein ACOQNY_01165 [Mycoplasmoidaceae bacterium]
MKKSKLLFTGITATALATAVVPALTLNSCGNPSDSSVLTLSDDQRVQFLSGNNHPEIVFGYSKTLTTDDKIEIKIDALETTQDADIEIEYDQEASVVTEKGKKLVLACTLTKDDGTPILDNSNLKFDLTISCKNDKTGKKWSESFTKFDFTYTASAENITVVPGYDKLFTQPKSNIQCLRFQLNGVPVSEDESSIGIEVTDFTGTGGVTGVETSIIAGHRTFDVEKGILYVWVKLTGEDIKAGDCANFRIRLTCGQWIEGEYKDAWKKDFDEQFVLTKNDDENQGAIVLPDERIDNGAGHNAGDMEKTYRLFYSSDLQGQNVNISYELIDENNLNIQGLDVGAEKTWGDTGIFYREFTVRFGKDGSPVEGDDISFKLTAEFNDGILAKQYDLQNFTFTFVNQKIETDYPEPEQKSLFTTWTDTWQMFESKLVSPFSYEEFSRIQYTIIPTENHTPNITIENRRGDVLVTKDDVIIQWDPTLRNINRDTVKSKDFAEFDVLFMAYDPNKNAIWQQQLDGFRLTKQNTPLTPDYSMDQTIDITDPVGIYKFTLGSVLDNINHLHASVEMTGSSTQHPVKLGAPTLEFVKDKQNAIYAKIPFESDGGDLQGGDFIEFNLTISSDEEGYQWRQTISGRMEIWKGFNLSRGVEIEVTAKRDKQWFLTSGANAEDPQGLVPAGTPFGSTSSVTIDTSVWHDQTGTDFPENRTYVLYLPEDPNKGMINFYSFDYIAIEVDGRALSEEEYKVSDSGAITINKGIVTGNSIVKYYLRLASKEGKSSVTKDTRFYWTFR